jgi:hypothetical protein
MIALLAHGLCCPLGPAEIAAAALAADLSRADQLAWAPLLGLGDDLAPAVGHAVMPAVGDDRLGALLRLAWGEYTRCTPPAAADLVLICQALPDELRWGPEGLPDCSTVVRSMCDVERSELVALGHVAPAAALCRADELISTGVCRRVLIAAVDSLLDPASLAWLANDDRLRGPETPDGLAPGEAAAWWLVGQPDPRALAHIEARHAASDGNRAPRDDAERLLGLAGGLTAQREWGDQTGEPWRNRALGWLTAQRTGVDLNGPGDNWGDLGACAALAMASVAITQPDRVDHLIWSLAEDGAAGCIRVS